MKIIKQKWNHGTFNWNKAIKIGDISEVRIQEVITEGKCFKLTYTCNFYKTYN